MKRTTTLLICIVTTVVCFSQNAYDENIKKANEGDMVAQTEIGICYYNGIGVAKDLKMAFSWIMKAAEQGYPRAQKNAGNCYLNGYGVEKDSAKAVFWYRKAAEQGDDFAQYNLGYCYGKGIGVTKDYTQAVNWYKKAAEQGNASAQNSLGYYYEYGYGVEKDLAKAVFWYRKAAEQGDDFAQHNLANFYKEGKAIEKDLSQAVYWYRKSAEQGNAIAQNNLGYYCENGYGVEKDLVQAVYWYRKAAEQGYDVAQSNLGFCYFNGFGVEKDLVQAVYWYRKAAEQGDARGQANLGSCYFNGEGVEKDLYQAEYWIGKAAEQGNEWALSLIPKVLSKINEQNNVKLQTTKEPSLSAVVDYNIPVTDKAGINSYAIIIGNEKYQNEVDVLYAENDAKIFKEYVKQTLGVPDNHIKYIANGTLNSIRIAVKWLAQAMDVCDGNSQAIFYYAGHGIPDESNKSAYLLPVDGIGSDPESAYSLDRLYGEFERMKAKKVMVFLDACFSGAKREEGMLASARGVAIKAKLAVPKGNVIIFTAAQGDETAYPYKDQRHGLFTYFLLRKLKETKGDVTLGDLADYLQYEVKRQSFIENKKMQTPTVTASQSVASSWKDMKIK